MTEEFKPTPKPKNSNSLAEKEMDRVEKHFKEFEDQVNSLTLDRMNEAPTKEAAPQTEIASVDRAKMKETYIKPIRSIGCREKFNEKFRKDYEHDKEYVHFEAENNEIIGEEIDFWTKPYAGMPAEEWKVPVNMPVWAPRYVAEQIKRCKYHRLVMKQNVVPNSNDGRSEMYGTMAADSTVQRLDARPASSKRSVFMGANNF